MFDHNIDPVLFSFLGLEIRYYGLVYVLGFIVLYFYLRSEHKSLGLKKQQVDDFLLYFAIGLIVGSRIFTFLVWNPASFFDNPLRIFYIWQGGMSYHGALFGGIIGGYVFSKKFKANFYKLADKVAIPALFFLGLGRITNFVNAELPGTITNAWWCVEYPNQRFIEGCRHPYQLYEAGKNFILFAIFGATAYFKKFKPGVLFLSTIIAYNVLRFFIDFYRDEASIILNLSVGQILCVIFVGVSMYYLIKIYKPRQQY